MVPTEARARRQRIVFALYALGLLAIGLGLRDPWPSDEPRFALVARWMVEHGDWLFPHRGSELYPDKPPLFMWLQGLAYLVTREWRIAFLLPSLCAGLITLGLVYDLARRLFGHRAALHAAMLLLVTAHFTFQFRNAQIDPVLVAWVTLANYGILRHLLLGPQWRWFALGCFFAGVGVITKGVGVIALFMLIPWLLVRRDGWRQRASIAPSWRWLAGAAMFFLPILLWLVPVLTVTALDGDAEHIAYVKNILFGQTVHRYAAPTGHLHGPLYFPGVILADWLPLSLLLPWAIPAWWRRLRRQDARFALPLAWVVLVLVFFSLSPGKRDVYILPALPMTALALAPLLPGLMRLRGPRRAVFALIATLGACLTLAAALAIFTRPAWAERVQANLDPGLWWLVGAIGLGGILIAAATRVRHAALGWIAFVSLIFSLYGLWGYPMLNHDRSAREVMLAARTLAGAQTEIGLVAWKEQNLLMAEGPVAEFGFMKPWPEQFDAATAWLRQSPANRAIFIQGAAIGDCVDTDRATHLGRANRREWWLVREDALRTPCRASREAGGDD